MSTFDVELVTPQELLFSEKATMVVVPGLEGDFGVLKDHSPMISALRDGVMALYSGEKAENADKQVFVAGGFAEVTAERCTVLAEFAADLSSTKLSEVKEALADAKNALLDASEGEDTRPIEKDIVRYEALVAALESKK